MTTVEQITLINDLTGLLCTFILLIITGASALIALFAYEAQRKSILITQWTTFKMLLLLFTILKPRNSPVRSFISVICSTVVIYLLSL